MTYFILFLLILVLLAGLVILLYCMTTREFPESLIGILPKGLVDAIGAGAAKQQASKPSRQRGQQSAAVHENSALHDERIATIEKRLQVQAQALNDLWNTVGQLSNQLEEVNRQLVAITKSVARPTTPLQPVKPESHPAAAIQKTVYPYVRYAQIATSRNPVGFADGDLSAVANHSPFLIRVHTAKSATYELTTDTEAIHRVLLSLNFYEHLLDVDNQTHGELHNVQMKAAGHMERNGTVWAITEKLKLIIS